MYTEQEVLAIHCDLWRELRPLFSQPAFSGSTLSVFALIQLSMSGKENSCKAL